MHSVRNKISILQKYDYNRQVGHQKATGAAFQFYKSTIIIGKSRSCVSAAMKFQFYKSTIIIKFQPFHLQSTNLFQFYKSTIIILSKKVGC